MGGHGRDGGAWGGMGGWGLARRREFDDHLPTLAEHRDRPGADYGRILGFVATAEAGVDEARVRDDLRRALPDYMIPNRIRVLASLPKSANGKIDRRALLETETR